MSYDSNFYPYNMSYDSDFYTYNMSYDLVNNEYNTMECKSKFGDKTF